MPVSHVLRAIVAGLVMLAVGGCSLQLDTLGGREKCWPESDQRLTSIWRGTLEFDASGGQLATPEGDVFRLLPGTLAPRVGEDGGGELVRGDEVVARAGDDVTLFGGAGSDGSLVVCGLEEVH